MLWLLPSMFTPSQGLQARRLRVHKKLWGNKAGRVSPDCPKRCSVLCNFMLRNKDCIRGRGAGLRGFFVRCSFIFCLCFFVCLFSSEVAVVQRLVGHRYVCGRSWVVLFASLVFSRPCFLQELNCLYVNLHIFSLWFFRSRRCPAVRVAAGQSAHHTSSSALLSFPFVPLVVNEMCLLPISPSMRPTACDFSVSVQNVRNQLPKRICKSIKQKHTSRWGMLHDLFANSERFVQPSSSMLVVLCSILTTFELL